MMASFEIIVALVFLSHVHSYPLADCGPQVCAIFEETQKTFENMCSLLAEIEETGVDWRFEAMEECPIKGCTREYNPVCGFANNNFRTFPNACMLKVESQETGVAWYEFLPGECEANQIINQPTVEGNAGAAPGASIRYQNNLNNTFNAPYVEGNFYNAATHNYYGFIVPYSPYAAVIPNTKLDLWTEETTGEPEDESDEEEPNAPSEPVIIAGTTFPSVMGALKYLSILTRDLLLYLKGTKNIVE